MVKLTLEVSGIVTKLWRATKVLKPYAKLKVSFTSSIPNFLDRLVSLEGRTEEHYSLEAFKKHIVALAGLKNEAEKRGLGSSIEIKICRLAKTAGGSKAFTINTQALWDLERTRFGNSSVLQGRYFC